MSAFKLMPVDGFMAVAGRAPILLGCGKAMVSAQSACSWNLLIRWRKSYSHPSFMGGKL